MIPTIDDDPMGKLVLVGFHPTKTNYEAMMDQKLWLIPSTAE